MRLLKLLELVYNYGLLPVNYIIPKDITWEEGNVIQVLLSRRKNQDGEKPLLGRV